MTERQDHLVIPIHSKISIGIGLLLSIIFLVVLYFYDGIDEVAATLSAVTVAGMLKAVVLYSTSLVIRAFRWRILTSDTERSVPFVRLCAITFIHTTFNNILPARLGELSYPLLQKYFHAGKYRFSVPSVIFVRVSELSVLGLALAIAGSLIGGSTTIYSFAAVGAGVALLGIIALVKYNFAYEILVGVFILVSSWFGKSVDTGAASMADVAKVFSLSHAIKVYMLSVLAAFFRFAFIVVIVWEVGVDTNVAGAVFGFVFCDLTTILPIHSFAGLGTMEAGWMMGFSLLGFTVSKTLISGVAAHVMILLNSFLLSAIGVVILARRYR